MPIAALRRQFGCTITVARPHSGGLTMRTLLIIGLLVGLLAGFLLSGRVATSQEEHFPRRLQRGVEVSDRWAFDISPYYWTAKRVPRGF